MKAFEVIDTLKIGSNTSIIIKDKGIGLKNGTALLDDTGKPYVILSVGMNNDKGNIETTTLLLEGDFKSKRIFV